MTRRAPRDSAGKFLQWYAQRLPALGEAALVLERYVATVLSESNLGVVAVSARAKTIASVRGKLLRKPYRRPASQLTDQLGLRVIVYHGHEVDSVAALLRKGMVIREKDSSDKRKVLGLREFGYRSYHLVGRLPDHLAGTPGLTILRRQTFEVQVRSLLEHIWAEIEHDVVYKSGAEWPAEIRRRFASLAGVLELLEHEFHQLVLAGRDLIVSARSSLQLVIKPTQKLDVPFMCALLEVERPSGLSFRKARDTGNPFPPGIEHRLYLALRQLNVLTIGSLLRALRSDRMVVAVRRYAAAEGVPRTDVSHLAVLALAVGSRSRTMLETFFPELAGDPSIALALGRNERGRS